MFYIENLTTEECFLNVILFCKETEMSFGDIIFKKAIWSYGKEMFLRDITYSPKHGSATALKI